MDQPGRRRRHRIALAPAAALLVAAASAPAARAELPWAPCPGATAFQCSSLRVPLDRTGAVPGGVTLQARRLVASSNPANSAVVALAGGPGQAATPLAAEFAQALSPALASRDLVVFDQRGTGGSNPLRCSALRTGGDSFVSVAERCGLQVGPGRAFFRTTDSVEDLEALRVNAGYASLVLAGVSYGTKVALEYAARYPANVEALVLDSVVTPEGPDPFRRSSLQAIPRVLRELCAGTECAAATPDAVRDIVALARRLARGRLRGRVVDPSGRRRRASIGQTDLFQILLAGDLNPTLRAELPGSVRAALRGDRTPLLRLGARSTGLADVADGPADNRALFLATTCEEAPFPWTRGAPVAQRRSEASAAARALPPGSTGPFTSAVALSGGVVPLCLGWPVASPPPVPIGPLPAVPALVLGGQADVRTPLEDANALAGRIPGAAVVAVPNTGHSVLGNDLSQCVRSTIASFFGGHGAPPCAAADNPFSPTPRPPTRISRLQPSGVGGLAGRTLTALQATVTDARRQAIGETLAQGTEPRRVGGLRSGYATVTPTGLRFTRMAYVPGVEISGVLPDRGTASFRIGGHSAARGSVRVTTAGAIDGRLGGRPVHTRFRARVASLRGGRGVAWSACPMRWPARHRPICSSTATTR